MAERFEDGTVVDVIGKGLVREGRARRDQIRKRQERYQRRLAAAQIAVPIGAALIKDNLMQKAQDFAQSEEVLNLKRQHENAIRDGDKIFATENAIAASGGGEYDYFEGQIRPIVESQIDRETSPTQEGLSVSGDTRLNPEWHKLVDAQVKELTEQRVQTYRDSLTAARKLVSQEDFDSMLASQIRRSTPTDLVGFVGRKISTLFGGKTTEERQRAALSGVRNHYMSTDAKALSDFNTKYQETGNIRNAVNWTDAVNQASLKDYEPQRTTYTYNTTVQAVKQPDGSTIMKELTLRTPVYDTGATGQPELIVGDEVVELSESPTLAQQNAIINSFSSRFDVDKDPLRVLKQEAHRDWLNTLTKTRKDSDGNETIIFPNNVKTLEEYEYLVEEFNNYVDANPNSLREGPESLAMKEAALEAWTNSLDYKEKMDNLGRTGYFSIADTPEYNAAENYYLLMDRVNRGETVDGVPPKPANYEDTYLPAIEAKFDFFGTLEMIKSGPDNDTRINEIINNSINNSITEPDTEITTATNTNQTPSNVEEVPRPESLQSLYDELENAPTSGGSGRSRRRTKSVVQADINSWAEDTQAEINRLEALIAKQKRDPSDIRPLYFDDALPSGPNAVGRYEDYVQGLKDELIQLEKYNEYIAADAARIATEVLGGD